MTQEGTKMKIKLYKNYGVLAHEKEPYYTYLNPASDVYDRVTVDVPHIVGVGDYGEYLVLLGGTIYTLQDVLSTVDDAPALRWYDGRAYQIVTLPTVEGVE